MTSNISSFITVYNYYYYYYYCWYIIGHNLPLFSSNSYQNKQCPQAHKTLGLNAMSFIKPSATWFRGTCCIQDGHDNRLNIYFAIGKTTYNYSQANNKNDASISITNAWAISGHQSPRQNQTIFTTTILKYNKHSYNDPSIFHTLIKFPKQSHLPRTQCVDYMTFTWQFKQRKWEKNKKQNAK